MIKPIDALADGQVMPVEPQTVAGTRPVHSMGVANTGPVRRLAARAAASVGAVLVVVTSSMAAAGGPSTTVPADDDAPPSSSSPALEAQPVEAVQALAVAVESGDRDPTDLRGDDAVDVLVGTGLLDDVAAGAGLTDDELVDELRGDASMFVASTGHVGYVELFAGHDHDHGHEGPHELVDAEALAGGPLGATTSPTPLAPMLLESNPGAEFVLHLDFDGHETVSPRWVGGCWQDGVSAPFEGSGAEIIGIWQRVAEDYAPFGVNVTTRSDLVPDDPRAVFQRVVVSPTNFLADCGVSGAQDVLGVAFLDTFGDSPEAPAYAFTGQPFSSVKTVAEAISHEAGHTFGLAHDGRRRGATVDEYYLGHDGWAPIMGNPVAGQVTQWSAGEYRCANNPEDDLATIATLVDYRTDDWPENAAPDAAIIGAGSVGGIIGAGNDVDAIRVTTAGGPTTVTVTPAGPSPNLQPLLTVRGASGAVLGVGVPDSPAGPATVSIGDVAAGWFVVEVRPGAWYGPIAGFGTYGSMGAYEISVAAGYTPPNLGLSSPADSIAAAVGLDRQPVC